MTGVALLLLGVSVGDLVAGGLAGEPMSRYRIVVAVVACLGTISGLALGLGLPVTGVLSITALVVVVTSSWLMAKGTVDRGSVWDRPAVALGTLAVGFIGIVALSGFWIPRDDGWLSGWLSTLPDTLRAPEDGERLVLVMGGLLFMSAPANGIVRAVLSVAGSSWRESEQRLRGGRVIGLLERWLVLGLAVVGEPTAAALVVSAKSLLRFPELSRTVREEECDGTPTPQADWVTEYFLLGSLASWTIALGVAALY